MEYFKLKLNKIEFMTHLAKKEPAAQVYVNGTH